MHFSKSAPNLDKSRQAVSASSSSHHEILGKSHDGLNTIKQINNTDDEEDDEDEINVPGCWGFKKSDDASCNSKNSSVLINNNNSSNNSSKQFRIGSKVHVSPDYYNKAYSSNSSSTKQQEPIVLSTDTNGVNYDRVFYRNIQKSLDDIFSRDDSSEFEDVRRDDRVSSKSSDDLTMYASSHSDSTAVDESNYQFHRFESSPFTRQKSLFSVQSAQSKFKRECFIVKPSKSLDLAQNSADDHLQNVQDNFSSLDLGASHSDSVSNTDSTPSRKSSVTFRNDVDIRTDEYIYGTHQPREQISNLISITKSTKYCELDWPNNVLDEPSSIDSKTNNNSKKLDKVKVKPKSRIISKLFRLNKDKSKIKKRNSVHHSNSFFNKNSNTHSEMNEKLLTEYSNDHESPYEAIFISKNFVMAKGSDK